jgi:hypothetical protein
MTDEKAPRQTGPQFIKAFLIMISTGRTIKERAINFDGIGKPVLFLERV